MTITTNFSIKRTQYDFVFFFMRQLAKSGCADILTLTMAKNLKIDLFLSHPGFPLAVVPADLRNGREDGYSFVCHYHDFQELVVIVSGSGVQNINGVEYPVTAGDVFLLQGRDRHFFSQASPSLFLYNILYCREHLPLPLNFFRRIRGYNMIFRVEPVFRKHQNPVSSVHLDHAQLAAQEKLIVSLRSVLAGGKEGFEAESILLLTQLILNISRSFTESGKVDGHVETMERINRVISLMDKNFTHSFTVAELARMMHTSPRNFTRLFHKVTFCSPIEYLLRVRLSHAAELLTVSDISCADIAMQSGFADSNYFSRKFSEQYGLSPREYRKYNRENRD